MTSGGVSGRPPVAVGSNPARGETFRDTARDLAPVAETGRNRCRGAPGVTSSESAELKRLKRENAELRRANEILKTASTFSQRSSTVPPRDDPIYHHVSRPVRGRGPGPVTTKPAKTVDLRLDLVKRQFKADGPNRLWVADITYVRISTGFAYTAFVTDVFTRRIVGWAVASTMTTTALPLQALDHGIVTARGKLDQLVHHADHGSQYVLIIYSQHLQDAGVTSSTGSIGDWYDNAIAQTDNGLYKSEVIYPGGTWNTASQVELATMEWVDWWNNRRLHENLGYATPAEIEQHYNETRESQTALVNT